LQDSAKGVVGTCEYNPHLNAEAIDHLLQDLQQVLECMVVQPERPVSAILVPSTQRI
jgi:hypothetical protein